MIYNGYNSFGYGIRIPGLEWFVTDVASRTFR
jgi:hypothetical protein